MHLGSSLRNGIALYRALVAYFETPLDRTQAPTIVAKRLDAREERFLAVVRKAVYEHPASPYLALLRASGCEFADLATMVRSGGVEGALRRLAASGVYVTMDEFKGAIPLTRFGREFPIRADAFDNPYPGTYFVARTGATRSAGTPVPISLDSLAEQAVDLSLTLDAWELKQGRAAQWFPAYPGTGLNNVLRFAKVGMGVSRWFAQVHPGHHRPSPKARVLYRTVRLASRRTGNPIPLPETVSLNEAIRVARWIGEARQDGTTPLVRTFVSSAVRISEAAQSAGIDITGARLLVVGESLTRGKRRAIAAAGARPVPDYALTEAGLVAMACPEDREQDRMHLLTDQHAMITRRRVIEGGDYEVDSFVLTSLSPNAPKILFNVEVGDTGAIEPSRCGCAMHRVGLQTVLSGVYSFEKLTGEGMTLPGTDLLTVIEEALPTRFGGSPLDYQVVEEEDDAGRTRMTLFVHPGVGDVSPDQVIDAFLGELERLRPKSSIPHIWRQAGTLRVVREAPRLTRGGKLIPFHALGSRRAVAGSPAGAAH